MQTKENFRCTAIKLKSFSHPAQVTPCRCLTRQSFAHKIDPSWLKRCFGLEMARHVPAPNYFLARGDLRHKSSSKSLRFPFSLAPLRSLFEWGRKTMQIGYNIGKAEPSSTAEGFNGKFPPIEGNINRWCGRDLVQVLRSSFSTSFHVQDCKRALSVYKAVDLCRCEETRRCAGSGSC